MNLYTVATEEGAYEAVREELWSMENVTVLDELPSGYLQIEIDEAFTSSIVEDVTGVSAVSPEGPLEFGD